MSEGCDSAFFSLERGCNSGVAHKGITSINIVLLLVQFALHTNKHGHTNTDAQQQQQQKFVNITGEIVERE